MKTYQKLLLVLLPLLALAGIVLGLAQQQANRHSGPKPTEATVFFHGYGSSRNAEKSMSHDLLLHGVSNRTINVTVARDGQVSFSGQARKGDKNPIYLVQFNDNRNPDFEKTNQWVTTIMGRLYQQGIRSVNMVGHSMGNMAIVYYLKNHVQQSSQLPTVKRQIDIAGHFNGLNRQSAAFSAVNAQGLPSQETPSFQALAGLEQYYEQHATKVLNIFGNSTGAEQSDTTVPNNSSKSLRYFVRAPSSYQEQLITGKKAQHSKLHENPEVNQAIINFLKD
ncbi:alpha/beta hydrolase [Leuconostocaceae bacterium ESL0958]|nr:alpha/beta hydrolase [Leuconostocaceae bacterium ESL0958]